jgi:tRNA A37 threonylcarbamoyladenosine biosynthesis protein TsaE
LPRQRRQPDNDRWLWRDKILVGDLVVLVGEEGAGKTRLLADWIARVTVGQPFPARYVQRVHPPHRRCHHSPRFRHDAPEEIINNE